MHHGPVILAYRQSGLIYLRHHRTTELARTYIFVALRSGENPS
jgi:hypothetical protein